MVVKLANKKMELRIVAAGMMIAVFLALGISPLFAAPGLTAREEAAKVEGGIGKAQELFVDVAEISGFDTLFGDVTFPEVVIGNIIKNIMVLIGVIFVILVIYGGYLWMTARDNDEVAKKALGILKTAVIGFFIVVGAYSLTSYIVDKIILATLSQ